MLKVLSQNKINSILAECQTPNTNTLGHNALAPNGAT